MKFFILFLIFLVNGCASDYYYEYGKKVELKPLPSIRDLNKSDVRYYKTSTGRKIGIKNEIIVKLKNDVDIKDFAKKYDIDMKNIEKLSTQMYLIKLEKNQNVFKISQEMYQDNDTKFAVPNKVQKYFAR